MSITKNRPGLDWDEISIKLEINIPDELFKRPRLEATINIPEDAAAPHIVDCQTIENFKEVIKQGTGYQLDIKVINEDKKEIITDAK